MNPDVTESEHSFSFWKNKKLKWTFVSTEMQVSAFISPLSKILRDTMPFSLSKTTDVNL